MRTTITGLGCVIAVASGAWLGSWPEPVVIVAALLCAGVLVVWLRATLSTKDWSRTGADGSTTAMAVVFALGFLRGTSVGVEGEAEVRERGAGVGPAVELREFDVVGASEPGPRCRVELRDPRTPHGAAITVSAPPEDCPLAAGQRVAVLARSLNRDWRSELDRGSPHYDLGPGPVLWLRSSPRPRGIARLRVGYWRWVARTRQRAWESTRTDDAGRLVVAVALGLRSALAPEQRERLRGAGLGHLIAVSGLHVAVAALWLQVWVRRMVVVAGGSPRWACVITWLPLWAYVGLTGGAASAVRAAVMLTAADLSVVLGRPRHGPTLLAETAAAMLLWHPQWVFDPGFALSVAAMAAIVTAPSELGPLAMSWRITWATAPISVWCFASAPLHGLLGNAIALPMFAVLMPLALVAVLGPGILAEFGFGLAKLCATPILDLAGLLSAVPSVGAWGLAALAGLGWIAGRVGDPSWVWVPPRLACVLGLVVGLGAALASPDQPDTRTRVVDFDWVVVGTVHARTVVVADRSTAASVCMVAPTGSGAMWSALLELLEVRRIAISTPRDPGAEALVDRLVADGFVERGSGARCDPPPPEPVRAAIRACQHRQGGRGPVLASASAGQIHCRIADRWVLAPELGI